MSTQNNDSYFVRLSRIDVRDFVEKKGQFTYLSWPYAVSQLRQCDPTATWEVKRFDGLPYLVTDLGVFVEVAVTVQGVCLSQIHPVLDAKNRPIPIPTTFEINTSIQRCLVKAIALHGLGLGIYAGEDLPLVEAGETAEAESRGAGSDKTPSIAAPANPPAPPTPPRAVPTPRPAVSKVTALPTPVRPEPEPASRGDFVTLAQVRYITKLMAETDTELQKVLDYFGVERIEDIAKSEASRVIRSLEQSRDQRRSAA